MAALVIAEHDNASLKGSTLHTITAAVQCGACHIRTAGIHTEYRSSSLRLPFWLNICAPACISLRRVICDLACIPASLLGVGNVSLAA